MQQNIIQIKPIETIQNKVRVAAYVRVSTSKEDQLNSFAAQYLHYKKMFEDSSFEELIDVYVDEGISGTTTDKRNEFNRMIDDCERGRIQKIYVKSVSRFGRNTAESLAHIRYLKTLGISVFFEKENLDTAIEETEFRLTMMEYHAQEESISISKNVRIGEKYRMERGDYILKVAPYGYERYERTLVVNEAEAEIIKRIYQDYTSGKSIRQIVRDLNTEQIPRKGPTVPWKTAIVKYILTNEKYIGDQMYLKRYRTEDFPFKRVRNHGEHEYYYIEESHEPIISRTVFEYAQKLRISRVPKCVNAEQKNTLLSGAIHCGVCGKICRIVNRKDTVQWACRTHQNDASTCPTMPVPEAEIIRAFTNMYNKLKTNKKVIITPIINQLVTLKNRISAQSLEYAEIDRQIMLINDQLALIADLILVCGHCGAPYRRCVWTHHGSRKVVWRCTTRMDYGKEKCNDSFTIEEEGLHQAILKAISNLSSRKEELKDELKAALSITLLDTGADMSITSLEQQIKEQENDLMRVVRITAERGNKGEFETEFKRISDNIKDLKRLLEVEKTKIRPKLDIESRLEDLFTTIDRANVDVKEFNNQIIRQLIAQIRIDNESKMTVILTNGYRFEAEL